MISSIKYIYNSSELSGESLIRPLRNYNTFFAKKIEASDSFVRRNAWRIANFISGIVVYPVLGFIAGVGFLIKLTGVSSLNKYNEENKRLVAGICDNLRQTPKFERDFDSTPAGVKTITVKEFEITKRSIDSPLAEIQSEIDRLGNQFRRVHVSTTGSIDGDKGAITVRLGIDAQYQKEIEKPYCDEGKKALQYAREQLAKNPGITPEQFVAGDAGGKPTRQPVNREIALLTPILWDIAYEEFVRLMKNHGTEAFDKPEVIDAADKLMKLGYAVSNLTLDDLEDFTNALAANGEQRSFATSLTKQDSYQYRTFFYCTRIYHWLRGGTVWINHEGKEGFYFPNINDKAHLFYEEGTVQNSWNKMYNDFCARTRLYVSEADLNNADRRHVAWTRKDTLAKVDRFYYKPDELPS